MMNEKNKNIERFLTYFTDFIMKFLDYIFNKLVIGLVTSFTLFVFVYFNMQPMTYFLLTHFGLDLQDLFYFKTNEELNEKLLDMKETINGLKNDNRSLKEQLNKSIAEKEGFIKGLENIKVENINWYNVFKILIIVTTIGGVSYWFLFSGTDVSIVKPIISHITQNTSEVIEAHANIIDKLQKRIIENTRGIENLETKIELMSNMMSSSKK